MSDFKLRTSHPLLISWFGIFLKPKTLDPVPFPEKGMNEKLGIGRVPLARSLIFLILPAQK
jgi:hypothetical protein